MMEPTFLNEMVYGAEKSAFYHVHICPCQRTFSCMTEGCDRNQLKYCHICEYEQDQSERRKA